MSHDQRIAAVQAADVLAAVACDRRLPSSVRLEAGKAASKLERALGIVDDD